MLELLTSQMNSKHCKDQIYLLMHEAQTADLCYSLLADKNSDMALQTAVLKVNQKKNHSILENQFSNKPTHFFTVYQHPTEYKTGFQEI